MDPVALTFDDGPHPETTPALLAALGDAPATFFLQGSNAADHPDLVRAIAAAGHTIGNHSWTHPRLPALSPPERELEVARTQDLLTGITGTRPALFRPPYGDTDAAVAATIAGHGLAEILWTVDTRDWAGASTGEIVEASAVVEPGGVILMHDGGYASTVAAVPRILAALAARGLRAAAVTG
ncbi:polysaccharide deacetylase family protein [Amycolatopsis sp., V23-08]|uniref:Polysaccharide deacetylase family protein n=1 Tax=Amycolatopsis heterodermiae TaxID=3110235 RepID=A0ABU5RL52_9PSEU|nr:polysaccharide deacetylase family protein [Amycolatopsis sp., V23-08]MEA5367036.1 polysaccharide deacetylase family protein [Amycolatopsis sp., V23-08]